MRRIVLFIFLVSSFSVSSQTSDEDQEVVVKTIKKGDWSKWVFGNTALNVVESGEYNRWYVGLWGMELYIATTTAGEWSQWEVEYMNAKCTAVNNKKKNSWVFEGDGKTVELVADDKKMTAWTIKAEKTITLSMKDPSDKNVWLLKGLGAGTGSASLDVMTVFIPLFSAVISEEYKLK